MPFNEIDQISHMGEEQTIYIRSEMGKKDQT